MFQHRQPLTFLIAALAGAFSGLSGGVARAQLEWRATESSFIAPQTQRVVAAEYPFRNSGAFPVRILDIKTNCGCTAGRPDREIYQPGESGVISVAFNIENRMGPQEKKIVIKTDNPASNQTLWLKGEVIEGISLRPLVLRWEPDEAGMVKMAKASLPRALQGPLEVLGLEGDGASAFTAEVSPAPDGGGFEVRVRLVGEAAGQKARLLVGRRDGSLPPATLHLAGPK